MSLIIKNAILHVINNDGGESYFSTEELDIDSETCTEFISKHVKKLLDNPSSKEATFNAESKVYSIISSFRSGAIFFKEASMQICKHLSDIMLNNVEIPSADILIVLFQIDQQDYLSILKLNYKECYTHQVNTKEGIADNQIVKYRAVLPFDGGKIEEACLIPYDPMIIKLLEKPYPIDGELTNYFSNLFLECSTELSKKEAVKIINEITDEINEKFFNENVETLTKVKLAILEEVSEEEGNVSIINVANKVFGDNEEIKTEYIAKAKEAGIIQDIKLGEKFAKQQFGLQKFKADNGIEVKFPAELSHDPNKIEFINNSDGSVSIILKNLIKA